MRQAASETGAQIYIGAVSSESSGSGPANWNVDLMSSLGDTIDFYIIHSYFTPYNQNSTASVLLTAPTQVSDYMSYLNNCASQAGVSMKPVALTEYNTFAVGSKQAVSQVDGMFCAMVVSEAIKSGLGAASHWDLANGYNNGDDHGTYSWGDEPGVPVFNPRPVFYYLYYLQRFMGDIMLKSSLKGSTEISAYASSFSSGQKTSMIVNKSSKTQYVRVNFSAGTVGERYYYYTLTGGNDLPADASRPYSRQVVINGYGPSLVAGGPETYDTIPAYSGLVDSGLVISTPPLSVTYLLVDSGAKQLAVNDTLNPVIIWNTPADIIYGTKLSTTQLNASATVGGLFSYTPIIGTLLKAGRAIALTAKFTPSDSQFPVTQKTVYLNVNKATPVLTWSNPSDLALGKALSNTQLNAKANVPGSFTYVPPAGTMLDTGINQVLTANFLPTDTLDYLQLSKTVLINIYDNTGIPTLSASNLSLYPVPVSDMLTIKGIPEFLLNKTIRMRVISANGNLVLEEDFINTDQSHILNLTSLSPGLYLLQILTDETSMNKRFLKL